VGTGENIMNIETDYSLSGHDDADWLDSLLRESRPSSIDDEGFSQRVMQRVPAPLSVAQVHEQLQMRARKDRRFEWFTLIGALAGSALAYWGNSWPSPDEMASAIVALVELRPVSLHVLAPWLASLLSAAVLAYVMQKD
jgi:hypothetical protein